MGFICLALKLDLEQCASKEKAVWGSHQDGELSAENQIDSWLRALGQEQKLVHELVDMSAKLAESHLLGHIQFAVWPHTKAGCKLNKKSKTLHKSEQELAFVAVGLGE